MLDDATIDAYLDRIGAPRPTCLDAGTLRDLQERHVRSVPFENLDYHLGLEVFMDERVIPKIVKERRGGGCYEVNPGLFHLLKGLGFDVAMHPGSVWVGDELGPPYCHEMIIARVDDQDWLVDVGFGLTPLHPLPLAQREAQEDPHGEFKLVDADDGGIDLVANRKRQYRFYPDIAPAQSDFGPTLWWYRSSPDSPFLRNVFCSMPTAEGRLTIKDNKATRIVDGERSSEVIDDDAALIERYREWFGIELDRLPVKDPTASNLRWSFE